MVPDSLLGWLRTVVPAAPFNDHQIQATDLTIELLDLTDPGSLARYAAPPKDPPAGIVLYSDEWATRPEACKGVIRAKLGLFDRKVGARECEVIRLNRVQALEFLDAYHLMGSSHLSVEFFGLVLGGELLGMASVGRHSRQIAANRIVMDRMCFKSGVHIVGGAGRLVAACRAWALEEGYEELLTFSDTRMTQGAVYEKLGFAREQVFKSDYFYVKEGARITKQSQQKRLTGCPETLTELEWARHRGLTRVYDYGRVRWVINLKPGAHQTMKEKNSERAARMHQDGVFRHAHIRGSFFSRKAGQSIYYGSSYELRCMFLLDRDDSVASFRRADAFQGKSGWRNPDLLVTPKLGRPYICEVKPDKMLGEQAVQAQIEDSRSYAEAHSLGFKVWGERDSELEDDHAIISWASKYIAETTGDASWESRRKDQRMATRARYEARHPEVRVEVPCDHCHATHTVRKKAYDANMARHGRYVCESLGGKSAAVSPSRTTSRQRPSTPTRRRGRGSAWDRAARSSSSNYSRQGSGARSGMRPAARSAGIVP